MSQNENDSFLSSKGCHGNQHSTARSYLWEFTYLVVPTVRSIVNLHSPPRLFWLFINFNLTGSEHVDKRTWYCTVVRELVRTRSLVDVYVISLLYLCCCCCIFDVSLMYLPVQYRYCTVSLMNLCCE